MSTHSNPFVQGGWYNASFVDHRSDQTSVYGALPMTTGPDNGNAGGRGPTHFQFSNPNPNILNSSIIGPGSRELIRVSTDERLSGYTAFRDAEGRSIALIEWASRPGVEVRGAVPKGSAGDWLKVVQDPVFGRPVRRMEVRGAKFIWCPNGDALLLYPQGTNAASYPLVVVTKHRHVVNLEMSEQALSWGLLEPCVVAVSLLLSGRRLE